MNGTAATADTPYCDDVVIMGARGTGEQPGSGQVAGFGDSAGLAAVDLKKWIINNYIDANVGYKAIEYPALAPPTDPVLVGHSTTFISSGAFNGSVKQGVVSATSYLGALIATCPKTQVVMMGYSQGAEVMHEAANLYFGEHPEHSGNLSKVWLISDPTSWHVGVQDTPGGASYFTESGYGFIANGKGLISLMANNNWSPTDVGGLFNTYVKDKVVEICHTDDDICNTDDQPYTSVDQLQEAAGQLGLMFPSTHGDAYKDIYADIHIAPSKHNSAEIAMAVASMRIPDTAPKMISTWDTSLPGCSDITLPLTGTINARADWGDGQFSPITTSKPSHQYSLDSLGIRTVTTTGTFTGWGNVNSPSSQCLLEVSRWDETGTTDLSYAFKGAVNLTKVSGIPSGVTNMQSVFEGATSFNYPIEQWDISKVTSFTSMFYGATSFNQPIGSWNVSNASVFAGMFYGATSFNQPIGSWNMSNSKVMVSMFEGAISFNQPIGSWNVSKVFNFSAMFRNASSFNQDLHLWKKAYTSQAYMFEGCPILAQYRPAP